MGFRGLAKASLQALEPATAALSVLPCSFCSAPAALAPDVLPGELGPPIEKQLLKMMGTTEPTVTSWQCLSPRFVTNVPTAFDHCKLKLKKGMEKWEEATLFLPSGQTPITRAYRAVSAFPGRKSNGLVTSNGVFLHFLPAAYVKELSTQPKLGF